MPTLLLVLAASLAYPPADIDFATDVKTLARHDGCRVRATFKVGGPPGVGGPGVVLVSTPDTKDFTRRNAYLPRAARVNWGDTITVVGTVRLERHPAQVIAGLSLPAFVEVRLDGDVVAKP